MLNKSLNTHNDDKTHNANSIALKNLGETDISICISEAHRALLIEKNKQIEKNRQVLDAIIRAVFFCGNYELALRGHNESADSENQGIFKGLLHHDAEKDPVLREHLENSKVFKGTSGEIQNDILDSVLQVYRYHVISEIDNVDYVAVMADDSTDVSGAVQTVIVLRYVCEGELVERFWGYFRPESIDAEGISKCLLDELQKIFKGNRNKLVAQTYDGASVMSGKTGGVQAKVKEVYPNAHYTHCYAHKLNLIVKDACKANTSARVFFSNLDGIPTFFNKASECKRVLDKHIKGSLPRGSDVRWNYKIRTVSKVKEFYEPIKACFEEQNRNDKVVRKAGGFLRFLNGENVEFWLNIFNKILIEVNFLLKIMQKPESTL